MCDVEMRNGFDDEKYSKHESAKILVNLQCKFRIYCTMWPILFSKIEICLYSELLKGSVNCAFMTTKHWIDIDR